MRVITRLLQEARDWAGAQLEVSFRDHTRRAKRRHLEITRAPTNQKRLAPYRDLIKVTRKTIGDAERMEARIEDLKRSLPLEVVGTGLELKHYIPLARQVMDQAERRVLKGEQVPAADKIVSIFEPHTDIIVKQRRETKFGHKVCLTTGASCLVLDCVVEEGNPADSTLAVEMIDRQSELYGRPPRQVAFDGGFASIDNLKELKGRGVKDVAFNKKRGLKVTEMAKSSWVYKVLSKFRAGIEGTISYLKRCFGLDRCLWRGFESFKAYVWSSVLAHNLLVMARHTLG